MTDQLEHGTLGVLLDRLGIDAEVYFDKAEAVLTDIPREERWSRFERDHFWAELPQDLREEAGRLAERLLALAGQAAPAVRNAPLASEADQTDIMTGTKAMRATLLLREFRSWTTECRGTSLDLNSPAWLTQSNRCSSRLTFALLEQMTSSMRI